MEKLDGREFKGARVTCIADVSVVSLFLVFPTSDNSRLSQISLVIEDALALHWVVALTLWMTTIVVAHPVATAPVVTLDIVTEAHPAAIIMMIVVAMAVLLLDLVGLPLTIIHHHHVVAATMTHIVATTLHQQTLT